MAIKSITIENFKGIGDAVTIPIRPITLLFGKNSSGKSTVLQALLYMSHVIKYKDPNPRHLMGLDTDFTDLGSFWSFVHLHKQDRKIAIRIEFEVEDEDQLEWAEIKTGWREEEKDAYILSQKIGIGDDEWEYDDVPKSKEYLKTNFERELEGLRSLGPIRKELRDLNEINYAKDEDDEYIFKAKNGQHWDGNVQAWALILRDGQLRDGQLIDKVNDQIKYLKLGHDLVNERRNERTIQLALKDQKNQIYDPSDVGTGFSQILPVLVGVLEDSYRTFAVAQPELHVHPAVQVGLGDLFIDGIQNSNRTFLIETHSEHLLLRLLRRVRETTKGEQTEHTLTPDDLSVVYVQPTSEGVEFIPLSIMDDGDFDGPWPKGFFDERLQELL